MCGGTANFIEFERLRIAISEDCFIMWGEEKEGVGFVRRIVSVVEKRLRAKGHRMLRIVVQGVSALSRLCMLN